LTLTGTIWAQFSIHYIYKVKPNWRCGQAEPNLQIRPEIYPSIIRIVVKLQRVPSPPSQL